MPRPTSNRPPTRHPTPSPRSRASSQRPDTSGTSRPTRPPRIRRPPLAASPTTTGRRSSRTAAGTGPCPTRPMPTTSRLPTSPWARSSPPSRRRSPRPRSRTYPRRSGWRRLAAAVRARTRAGARARARTRARTRARARARARSRAGARLVVRRRRRGHRSARAGHGGVPDRRVDPAVGWRRRAHRAVPDVRRGEQADAARAGGSRRRPARGAVRLRPPAARARRRSVGLAVRGRRGHRGRRPGGHVRRAGGRAARAAPAAGSGRATPTLESGTPNRRLGRLGRRIGRSARRRLGLGRRPPHGPHAALDRGRPRGAASCSPDSSTSAR